MTKQKSDNLDDQLDDQEKVDQTSSNNANSADDMPGAEQEPVDEASEDNAEESNEGDNPELQAAHAEIAKLKDAFLRAKAEEDNVRRRSEKEVANSRKFAVEGFSKEMLNVYDSLKLACAVDMADDADESIKSIHEGVQITLKQLDAAFARFSVTEILPEVGDKLDPNLHQAMSMVESDEVESGCILNVIQSGFQLHDRLLRPTMVVVAK